MVDESAGKGRLNRVRGAEHDALDHALDLVPYVMLPEDRSQRAAFAAHMPKLYKLKNDGYSFHQLTSLIQKSGMKLQISTVRTYYYEMLVERADELQRMMNDQMLLMAETDREQRQKKAAFLKNKIAQLDGIRNTSERDVAVADILNISALGQVQQPPLAAAPPAESGRGEAAVPPREKPKVVDAVPASTPALDLPPIPPAQATQTIAPIEGGFGLAVDTDNDGNTSGVKPANSGGFSSFFDNDSEPLIPNLANEVRPTPPAQEPIAKVAAASPPITLKCAALQKGVTELESRADVPKEVYQEGLLEHPAIPGLLLSKAERVYGASLELVNVDGGEILRLETPQEKRFRIKWQKPIPMSNTSTSSQFVKMNPSVFKNGHA